MTRALSALALLAAAVFAMEAAAQQPTSPPDSVGAASSPSALADTVLRRFASGSPAQFDSVYPFEEGRRYVASAVQNKQERRPGIARVLRASRDTAVLLLSGYVAFGNPGPSPRARGRTPAPRSSARRGGRPPAAAARVSTAPLVFRDPRG